MRCELTYNMIIIFLMIRDDTATYPILIFYYKSHRQDSKQK